MGFFPKTDLKLHEKSTYNGYVELLIGDPTKANTKLGWKPKYALIDLVREIVEADITAFKKEKLLRESEFDIKNQFE